MGVLSLDDQENLERYRKEEDKQSAKTTIVKLPCCGAGIEIKPKYIGEEILLTCPNKQCPKARALGRAPRHMISWTTNPTLSSELMQ